MVTKPTEYPDWAENNELDPISGQYNVIKPPPEKVLEGWARGEFPPRNWFNFLLRYAGRWVRWLDQQESKSVVIDNAGVVNAFDVIVGGMAIIYVIDTTTPANFYHGIAYIDPSPAVPITVTEIASSTLTVSTISISGIITASGGSGDYIINGQLKNIP